LLFTYLGQAAYLIEFPSAVQSVYYNSLPPPVYWPMFVVATLAAIVASQVGCRSPNSAVNLTLDGTGRACS
jgi:K+ transporter